MRYKFLDSFRGITIFAMILSGSIAFNGVLPGFMYHAQVPPPTHVFNGNLPGITWVDLVFPFFLFAMGVSIPLSLSAKLAKGESKKSMVCNIFYRGFRLAWFAILIQLIKQRVVDGLNFETALYILISFIIVLLQFSDVQKIAFKKFNIKFNYQHIIMPFLFFILSVLWFVFLFPNLCNMKFTINRSDIIILVLANVSVSGALIWLFTRNNILARCCIFLFIIAFVLNGKFGGGYLKDVYDFSGLNFIFRFEFHKYLLIVLPATLIGEILLNNKQINHTKPLEALPIVLLQLLILIVGTTMLYMRLVNNFIIWFVFASISLALILKYIKVNLKSVSNIGLLLLWLGILIEPLQGGIKKDSATFSYFFVTGGFACLFLHALFLLQQSLKLSLGFFNSVGNNALGAYEMGKFILYPIMVFTGTNTIYNSMVNNVWQGFFRGLIYTIIACSIAWVFSKWKLSFKA